MRQEEPRMAINAEGDGGPWTLGRKTRAEGDSRGEGRGGGGGGSRCVLAELTTNSARDKCLRPRTKKRRGKINEKERETASQEQPRCRERKADITKNIEEKDQKRGPRFSLCLNTSDD